MSTSVVYQLYPSKRCEASLFASPLYRGLGLNPEVNADLLRVCPELSDLAKRNALAEYVGMLYVWRSPPVPNARWVGFTSYRQLDKTDFVLQQEDARSTEELLDEYDLLGWGFFAHNVSIMAQAEACHPGIEACFERVFARFGYELPGELRRDRLGLFCNYWIVSRGTFDAFMRWSWPMVKWMLEHYQEDPFLQFSGRDHFGPLGFMIERLIIAWYYLERMGLYDLAVGHPILIHPRGMLAPWSTPVAGLHGRALPLQGLLFALLCFGERGGRCIVELGSMRYPPAHPASASDGRSTVLWGWSGADVFSVDHDRAASAVAEAATSGYPAVQVVTADAVQFLHQFHRPIDLLFLDAWDVGAPRYQEHHLEAFLAARRCLHANSVVVIDDTDLADGGKGALVVVAAKQDGFRVILDGRVTVLVRRGG